MFETLPLNALRVFAVAARRESFKHAADELYVTAGAVSRQVRLLEQRIEQPLFERGSHGVRLNSTGRWLSARIEAGLTTMAAAYDEVRCADRPGQALSVSAPPSFLQHWLLPRLSAFDAAGAEVAVEASQTLIEPEWHRTQARLAIRYGHGPWSGVSAHPLLLDTLYPVCAPGLLERGPVLREPADLAHHQLLHVLWSTRQGRDFPGWREWLDAAGAPEVATPVHRRYSLFGQALDQAIAGRGVVLASHVVVADRIASGVLVRPFGNRFVLEAPLRYELIVPGAGSAMPSPLVKRFVNWLQNEASAFTRTTAESGGRASLEPSADDRHDKAALNRERGP